MSSEQGYVMGMTVWTKQWHCSSALWLFQPPDVLFRKSFHRKWNKIIIGTCFFFQFSYGLFSWFIRVKAWVGRSPLPPILSPILSYLDIIRHQSSLHPLVMSQVVQLRWCYSHSTGHYWGVNVLFSVGSERNPHSQGS